MGKWQKFNLVSGMASVASGPFLVTGRHWRVARQWRWWRGMATRDGQGQWQQSGGRCAGVRGLRVCTRFSLRPIPGGAGGLGGGGGDDRAWRREAGRRAVCARLWRADACAQGVPVARTAGSPYVCGSSGDSQECAGVQGTGRGQGTRQWGAGRRPRSWRRGARLRSRSAGSALGVPVTLPNMLEVLSRNMLGKVTGVWNVKIRWVQTFA